MNNHREMANKTSIGDKFRTYLKHPGSFITMLLVMLAAVITFAVLIFLIAYILINGVPHITPSLFSLEYSALGWGFSLLAGAFTIAIMILPLIMRTTEEALKAVPDSYREG